MSVDRSRYTPERRSPKTSPAVVMADVPPQLDVEATFGKGGAASALIYRQCFGSETMLLLVVKNPEKLSDGAEWLWVKSGKYASEAK